MVKVDIREAKIHLTQLIARALAGEEVIIVRAGTAVARLLPIFDTARVPRRVLGRDVGQVWLAEDFDAPSSDDVQSSFER